MNKKPQLLGSITVKRYEHELHKTDHISVKFPRSHGRPDGNIIVTPSEYEKKAQLMARLIDEGAAILDKFTMPTLSEIDERDAANAIPIATSKPGWKGESPNMEFLLPDHWSGPSETEPLIMPGTLENCIAVGNSGMSSSWNREVALPAGHSSYVAIAILTSLAGPLLEFSTISESLILNLAGQSSTGKTTASMCAASVWGNPTNPRTWNSTPRALAETAAANHNLCMVPDDIEQADEGGEKGLEMLQKSIHILTSGNAKQHSKVVSGGDQLPRINSKCTFVSSSPQTVESFYRQKGKARSDGDRVRLLEIQVPNAKTGGIWNKSEKNKSSAAERSEQLKAATVENHGAIGRVWVDYLVCRQGSLKEEVEKYSSKFMRLYALDLTGPQRRIAAKLGLLYATARIAFIAGVLPWKLKQARKITRFALDEILNAGFVGKLETAEVMNVLFKEITGDQFAKFANTDVNKVPLPNNSQGFYHTGIETAYLRLWAFKSIASQAHPAGHANRVEVNDVLAELRRTGVVLHGHNNGPTRDVRTAGQKSKFLVFNVAKLKSLVRKK